MKIAAIYWKRSDWNKMNQTVTLISKIMNALERAIQDEAKIIVFPGFTGCFFQQLSRPDKNLRDLLKIEKSEEYIGKIKALSKNREIIICPGSYWYREKNRIYHQSSIIKNGKILLTQKQIYLARWEREIGISRGSSLELINLNRWKLGIILPTDVFYPQVSRYFALKGVDLILSPVGFVGKRNPYLQLSGMWQEVQQNQFFAVESGFNGFLAEKGFWSESTIHAPLEMTINQDGFLADKKENEKIIFADLNYQQRKNSILKYDVLKQLNRKFYQTMRIFLVDK